MATSPDKQLATMLANIPAKTGKPLAAWIKLIHAESLTKHGAIMKFLKGEHRLTHGFANLIAQRALASDTQTEDLVGAQYAGAKQHLRPILDAVLNAVKTFGDDVEIAPKKTSVSLRRNKQFALVQPSTKTRVDIGINLKGEVATARLEASGSFSAMVSHRVRVASVDEVDAKLTAWLRQAYDNA